MENNQKQYNSADLLLRYLQGELTPLEEEELAQWVQETEENRRFFDKVRDEKALEDELRFFSSLDTEQAWQRIASQTVAQEEQRSFWRSTTLWRYAAAIAFILCAALVLYQARVRTHDQQQAVAAEVQEQQAADILPGGDKAMLTTSDGAVFMLEEMPNGTVREEQGVKVSKQDGLLTFEIAENSSSQVFFNTISTPVGGQYQILLPDGSKVWLNSASTLHFPSAFAGKERVVELTGEAYFEVAKKQQQPFRVHLHKATVEVLGTHFNIMAYPNEGNITATLLEGSVKVGNGNRSKLMAPGQQANIGEEILLKEVDVDEAVAWKNGL